MREWSSFRNLHSAAKKNCMICHVINLLYEPTMFIVKTARSNRIAVLWRGAGDGDEPEQWMKNCTEATHFGFYIKLTFLIFVSQSAMTHKWKCQPEFKLFLSSLILQFVTLLSSVPSGLVFAQSYIRFQFMGAWSWSWSVEIFTRMFFLCRFLQYYIRNGQQRLIFHLQVN